MGDSGVAPQLTLDHCGCIAADLNRAAFAWERLGFTLSPLSPQRGAVPGLPGMQPWATSNRCALFERGYLELIGVTRREAHDPWASFLTRGAGLHILALRCDDADTAYAALEADAPFLQSPVQREREVDVDGHARMLRFRNIFSRDVDCPEARYILIEHQTPELLWQRRYLTHENSALSLHDVTLVTEDCTELAGRIGALGAAPGITIVDAAAFTRQYGYRPQRLPGLHALGVGVRDLRLALGLLAARGIPVTRSEKAVWIAPQYTGGFVLRMLQVALT
ncbi:MAG: VOC family protein [Proteobacteria bacterium]|nr:VOC family protein [Burkholderiales bacterium]